MDNNSLIDTAIITIVGITTKELVSAIIGWLKSQYSSGKLMPMLTNIFTSVHLNPIIDAATIFGILWYLHHRFGGQAFIAGSDAPDLIAVGLAAGYFANSFIRGCDAIRRSRQP